MTNVSPSQPFELSEATLAALVEASTAMSASLDLSEVLQAIVRCAAGVLKAEASSLLLLDSRRRKLVFRAVHGIRADELLGKEFDADRGIAGMVASTGQPELIADVPAHPRHFGGFDQQSDFRTRTMIAAPLQLDGQTIGVVEVINKRGEQRFTEHDLNVLQVFANLAAVSARNAQRHQSVLQENRGLLESARADEPVMGRSPAWLNVMQMCEKAARTSMTVLLLGETGVGKEITARWIHRHSQRADRPFIALHCAALPDALLESELFGHEAGAFTGATGRKPGRFELADGGTLFLDEIGDVNAATQVKLLRVLQEREFVRVGGTKTIACDVRIIAATNRDLAKAMQSGAFREDLYYRINVVPITIPALRERREDIPALVENFVVSAARQIGVGRPGVSSEVMNRLTAYRWPGNIRELKNVIERAVLLSDGVEILVSHLPLELARPETATQTGGDAARGPTAEPQSHSATARVVEDARRDALGDVENYERDMLLSALQQNGWNVTRTAARLGMSRDQVRYRMEKYDLVRPGSESD
ncbi:MAG: sigma 54-interacting transcriptional regulator [Phycisphaerales bacterium]|nr:sigma 54-interacting transcriptional regulator [Phycisphaerales bacterium]